MKGEWNQYVTTGATQSKMPTPVHSHELSPDHRVQIIPRRPLLYELSLDHRVQIIPYLWS